MDEDEVVVVPKVKASRSPVEDDDSGLKLKASDSFLRRLLKRFKVSMLPHFLGFWGSVEPGGMGGNPIFPPSSTALVTISHTLSCVLLNTLNTRF